MQRNWLRVFLLCVMCAVCLHGNCAAERWVQYYDHDYFNLQYVDVDSIKIREYEDRKYLEVKDKWLAKKDNGQIVEHKKRYLLYDIENRKVIYLEDWHWNWYGDNRIFIDNAEVSTIKNGFSVDEKGLWYEDRLLLQWIEQNRPDVIQEILAYNAGGGGNQPILDLGEEVKIPIRMHPEWTYSAWKNPFDDVPYEYGVGAYYFDENGRRRSEPELFLFDYDPETKYFTFSGPALQAHEGKYMYRVRVINHNTVEIEHLNYDDENPAIDTAYPHPHEIYTYRQLRPAEKNLIIGEFGDGSAASPCFVSEHGVQFIKYRYRDGSSATVVGGYIWDWGITDIIAVETAIALSELGAMPGYPEPGSPAYGFYNSNIDITSWLPADNPAVSSEVLK